MMEYLQAVVYGTVQGLTEFLPISSTAHLRLVPLLFGWKDPGAAYSAVIQIGTILAVMIYFRRDILELLGAFFGGIFRLEPGSSHRSKLAWYILFGTLPISVCGVLLKKHIEHDLRSLTVVTMSLLVFGVLLLVAEFLSTRRKDIGQIGWLESQVMGVAQTFALIPGTSRSGVTITAGLFMGLNRETAAKFSFLLSIPAVTAAGLFELKDVVKDGSGGASPLALAVAMATSFIVGYACIALLLKHLRTRTTYVFSVYRILLAGVIFVFVL